MKKKRFLFLLALLALSLLLFRWVKNQGLSLREEELLEIPAEKINLVEIQPAGKRSILLKKESASWIVTDGTWSTPARPSATDKLLASIRQVPLYELVANDSMQWSRYGVDPEQGLRIVAWAEDDKVADFLVGQPEADSLHRCFVRLSGQPETFSVPDLALTTIATRQEDYLDNRLVKASMLRNMDRWSYRLPDTLYRFSRKNGRWWLEDSIAVSDDSIDRFFNELVSNTDPHLAFDVDAADTAYHWLGEIHLNTPEEVVVAFTADSNRTERPFLIHSSMHSALWYAADSASVFGRFLRPISYFVE